MTDSETMTEKPESIEPMYPISEEEISEHRRLARECGKNDMSEFYNPYKTAYERELEEFENAILARGPMVQQALTASEHATIYDSDHPEGISFPDYANAIRKKAREEGEKAERERLRVLNEARIYWSIGRIEGTIRENKAMVPELEGVLSRLNNIAKSLETDGVKKS